MSENKAPKSHRSSIPKFFLALKKTLDFDIVPGRSHIEWSLECRSHLCRHPSTIHFNGLLRECLTTCCSSQCLHVEGTLYTFEKRIINTPSVHTELDHLNRIQSTGIKLLWTRSGRREGERESGLPCRTPRGKRRNHCRLGDLRAHRRYDQLNHCPLK